MIEIFIILICAVLAVVLIILSREVIWLLSTSAPVAPQVKNVGSGTSCCNPIPKIIWSYWHTQAAPTLIERCFANWRQFAHDYDIRIITPATLTQWLEPNTIIQQFASLPPYRQADWLRVKLLSQYGGIWMDASIILTQSPAWIHTTQEKTQCEYVGFYIDLFTNRTDQPIIENWFMAAPAQSTYIGDLLAEFNRALDMGEAQYLAELKTLGLLERVVQNIAIHMQEYLIMHVAAAVILHKNLSSYRLTLTRAEDSALLFLAKLHWSRGRMYLRLALTPCPSKLPPLIKFRNRDRQKLDKELHKGRLYHGSILARYLHLRRAEIRGHSTV